jgi:eukaryotic-like serine/threonine-protein kinase
MKAERWRQIEEAFHGALQRERLDRESYLGEVCGDDQELLNEVHTLIACYELPGEFLEKSQLTIGMNLLGARCSELKKNDVVGPYVIDRSIGRGGMGDVYLARDERLGRHAALKLLPKSFENDPDWVARFRQEARAASSIAHPNVAHIYEVNEFQGRHYIAMEYIDGVTLRSYLRNSGPLRPSEAVDITVQIAKALMAAHMVGVLHRDIKPDNVMIHRDGYVKVLDFGLAKSIVPFTSLAGNEGLANAVETDAGIIVGSPAYMSPEQARAQKVDHRSDLWSLGVVLYELLTNTNPFLSETSTDTIAAILKNEPQPLALVAPDPAKKAQPIITRLLAKKVQDRFPEAQSLIGELQQLSEELKYETTLEHSSERGAVVRFSVAKTTAESDKRQLGLFGVISSASNRVIEVAKPTKLRVSVLALLIITIVILVRYNSFSTPAIHASPITSLAVLPFANGNGDPNSQYITDGLSEALIERLSRLSRIKVIARSSSFKYRDKSAELKNVATDLNVRAIVVGTVTKQGDDLHVRVELVDTNEMTRRWSDQYRYKTSELPIILNDISRNVASSLNLGLTNDDLNLITRSNKGDGDAYEWYLKGRFYWNQLTEEALDKSIECFNQALTIDPDYSLAYTGLANSYITLGAAYRPTENLLPKAEVNAQKALELDRDLAEAHYAMAVTNYVYHWDLAQAESELNRSLELNPNFAMANSLLSTISLNRGDLDQATTQINRALELDPFSLLFNSRLSYIYYCQRDSEKQIKLIQSFLARDPSAAVFYNDMAIAYAQMGKFDDALAASQRAMVLMGQDSDTLSTLAIVYALSGKRAEATWVAESLKELSNKKYVSPFLMATAYSAIGDKDQAFAWLEKAVQQHDTYILRIKVDSIFDGLRSDSRYEKLLQSINLT